MNSPWDFEYVFETMDDYWVGQNKSFCPESTATMALQSFSQKVVEIKIWHHFEYKKNLLLPLISVVEIFLQCTIFEFEFFCLQELPNNWYEKQKML